MHSKTVSKLLPIIGHIFAFGLSLTHLFGVKPLTQDYEIWQQELETSPNRKVLKVGLFRYHEPSGRGSRV